MATKGARHRGVKLLDLGTEKAPRWVARWRDPISRRQVQRDLAPLGLLNAKARERWAIEKLKVLQADKARIALDGVATTRTTLDAARTDYMALFSAPNTKSTKTAPMAGFLESLTKSGVRFVQDITAPVLAAYGDHVRRPANEHLPSTRNLHLSVAQSFLRWCRRRGMLPRVTDDQIADTLQRQKAPRAAIEVLQPRELAALLQSALAHDTQEPAREEIAPFVAVVLGTGMRFAEAMNLTWAEVALDEKVITLGAGRTKTQDARVITLAESPFVLDVLAALRLRGSKVRVFPHLSRGTAEATRRRTQLEYDAPTWTWHMLRRTCGSLLVCGGVLGNGGAFLTAKRLGHNLAIAERHYLTAYRNLPPGCTTLEQLGGFEQQARAIVRRIAGVEPQAVAQ